MSNQNFEFFVKNPIIVLLKNQPVRFKNKNMFHQFIIAHWR